jgi:flagella basal body P-ring formation protein FlgA
MRVRILLAACFLAAPVAGETLVAATTIRGASTIGPADVAVVPGRTPGTLSNLAEAIGMEARVNLYPGRPIRAGDLRPPAVIDRNEIVTLRYDTGGILILTEGRALDRVAVGESLRVLNLSSRTTVSAIAAGPGLARVGALP